MGSRMQIFTSLGPVIAFLAACQAGTPVQTPTAANPAAMPVGAPVEFTESLLATDWKGRAEGNMLFPLDPASGRALPGYTPISLGQSYAYAFSPDRHTLAAVTFPSNDHPYNGSLMLIDLAAWKARKLEMKLDGWVQSMVFSPDGGRLGIAMGDYSSKLLVFDIAQEAVTAESPTDSLISRMKFTHSGEELMTYGLVIKNRFTENEMSGGPPQVFLFDAADLSTRWSAELQDVRDGIFLKDEKAAATPTHEASQAIYLNPGLAFAPGRDILYIVHADAEQLTTVDFDAQKVETVEITSKLTWVERLLSLTAGVAHAKVADGTSRQAVVSPDGQFLYVIGVRNASSQDPQGNWKTTQAPLGLEMIQTADGGRVARFDTEAADLSISPDGRFLYLRNWGTEAYPLPWTEVFDTSTGQLISHKDNLYLTPTFRMNGEPLLVSSRSITSTQHWMAVLDPYSLSVLAEWTSPDYIAWLTTP